MKKLDISHKGFHALRHTFATHAIECGMDVKSLSEILGHKNTTITLNRYAHSLWEHKSEMMNKIGKLNETIWIIETKGGFDRTGASEDIDIFSPKKFEVLNGYLNKHNLKGGFVRFDKQSEELCICTENYSDDIHSDAWQLLSDIFK